MRDWTLTRVMWVADRGFSSDQNRRELRRGGGHYLIGEKLRSGSAEATATLSRQGRYQHVRDNLQVERGWRDMKATLELRPVYHRLEERIRADVLLCWLALLLVRIVETTTGDTWNHVRTDLQELHVGTFEGPAGTSARAPSSRAPNATSSPR